MLIQLSTVKQRLAILDTDAQYDALLTSAIQAVSARFDTECHRTFARTDNATDEFDAADTEFAVSCYPIETVTKFELKSTESEGWQQITPPPSYLIRKSCVLSLHSPLLSSLCTEYNPDLSGHSALRITYTGGYVLPGTDPSPPMPPGTPLPADLEQAAGDQVVAWFQNRDRLGLTRLWPYHGAYQQVAQLPLLLEVTAVLKLHSRWRL